MISAVGSALTPTSQEMADPCVTEVQNSFGGASFKSEPPSTILYHAGVMHSLTVGVAWCALLVCCSLPAAAQFWELDNIALRPGVLAEDRAGQAVGMGDFDGDGFDDLAFGVPGWDSATATDAGKVCFLFGTATRVLEPAAAGVPTPICVEGPGETSSNLGWSIATGDFDGDGRDEVAVGLPQANVTVGTTEVTAAGKVWIFDHTGATGDHSFDPSPMQLTLVIDQGSLGSFSAPEADDRFGGVLTVGNFDGDAYADLAIGIPYEGTSTYFESGAVQVVYGSSSGLDVADSQGFQTGTQSDDRLGWSLAAGDFDGDGFDDLAAGVPYQDYLGVDGVGVVFVYSGSATGLSYHLFLSLAGFPGETGETNARFGWALAAGDFDRAVSCSPCRDDLAIGVPVATDDGMSAAGIVLIAFGTDSGPSGLGGQRVNATTAGLPIEAYGFFGSALVAGRIDRPTETNGSDDLVVGAPYDRSLTGLAAVLFGSSAGIDAALSQPLPLRDGFALSPPSNRWGSVFALGDLDGDGWGDLVVGVPDQHQGPDLEVGAIQVLYGALFADGFESLTTARWSAEAP